MALFEGSLFGEGLTPAQRDWINSLDSATVKLKGCYFPPTQAHLATCQNCQAAMHLVRLTIQAEARRN